MTAAEVVHPLTTTTLPKPFSRMRLVLYSLVGEAPEVAEEGKATARGPREPALNAFALPTAGPGRPTQLEDIQRAFPLGPAHHFAFRNDRGVFVDLTNPSAVVPTCDNKIIARVTPLVSAPEVKRIDRRADIDVARPLPSARMAYDNESADSSYEDRQDRSQYEPFDTFCKNTAEERGDDRRDRDVLRRGRSTEGSRRGYRDDEAPSYERSDEDEDRYRHSGAGGNPNADWIRKQTEQAYDFAKKISMEDAKKNATETANKAKKWGASLLKSAKASLANATGAIKNETVAVGGMNVTIVRPLAEGAYAQVFLVRASSSGDMLAMKRVICQSEEVERDVHTELQVLRSVKHLNVMPLIEFAEARQQNLEFYFLFPYFERGSLWDAIESARDSSSPLWPFNQRVALHLFRGICAGLLAVHRGGFCHRDLKPHNVLLTSSSSGEDFMTFIPVITDFGSCAPIRVEVRSRKNSLDLQDEANRKSSAPYRAPELFEPTVDGVVDGQSDVWSLGCILYAMAFGTSPFEHPREGFMKLACMNGRVAFPPEQNGVVRHRSTQFSHEFCDFIRDMLHTNPEERPSVLDALEFAEELLSDEMKR